MRNNLELFILQVLVLAESMILDNISDNSCFAIVQRGRPGSVAIDIGCDENV